MSRDKLAELDREALIELILQQAQQIAVLQAEIEGLRKKMEKGKKASHEFEQFFAASIAGSKREYARKTQKVQAWAAEAGV